MTQFKELKTQMRRCFQDINMNCVGFNFGLKEIIGRHFDIHQIIEQTRLTSLKNPTSNKIKYRNLKIFKRFRKKNDFRRKASII